ncbi:hypothetical protein B7O87_14345 [Cylindrospermopsis raciborskii CENA303]|uniref:Uncharacterized protein n=1 Tax=Cylindrospermopsis raciborskii CENA303 TaxID=1170769 RepID=A0A1X4G3E4_9CYAN|nr:hypothetical protein B7O87_14345 [Cylindrospermopsis raciborskii CENA303]
MLVAGLRFAPQVQAQRQENKGGERGVSTAVLTRVRDAEGVHGRGGEACIPTESEIEPSQEPRAHEADGPVEHVPNDDRGGRVRERHGERDGRAHHTLRVVPEWQTATLVRVPQGELVVAPKAYFARVEHLLEVLAVATSRVRIEKDRGRPRDGGEHEPGDGDHPQLAARGGGREQTLELLFGADDSAHGQTAPGGTAR